MSVAHLINARWGFEHIQGERAGFTACGVAIDTTRQYGDREWWHCMSCERAAH